ncbi:MAG: type IV secretion system DNA-binding domain-containing protein, partial [Candidatus Aenigmarchaeota archaeon]|nr:type IV secretion system DNA-binding domain-containing protein [Candidatus Aenigmarchaeota archaeon]
VIGKTGMGKTTLLLNMILNDIRNGEGVGFIDPHGDASETLLKYALKERKKDLIYFNPADREHPIALNVLEKVEPERKHLVASHLISSFKRLWSEFWGPRLEYVLRNSILTLLEHPDVHTLGEVSHLLTSDRFRRYILVGMGNKKLKDFWNYEFPQYFLKGWSAESIAGILNKIGVLNVNPILNGIINQPHNEIDFQKVMDGRKIFIANLSKGKIGEDVSMLLGSLILSSFHLATLSRQEIPEDKRNLFFLFVDEFQNFVPENFTSILSEVRKYGLCLTLAHQYLGQLDEKLREAIFGNVGTIICFKGGIEDAEILEKEFCPEFKKEDLLNLDKYRIYLKMAINGKTSKPFSAKTLQPFLNF